MAFGVSRLPGKFSHTRTLRVIPRTLLVNTTKEPLHLRVVGDGQTDWVLPAYASAPWHGGRNHKDSPSSEDDSGQYNPHLVQLAWAENSQGDLSDRALRWSHGTVDLDSVGLTALALPSSDSTAGKRPSVMNIKVELGTSAAATDKGSHRQEGEEQGVEVRIRSCEHHTSMAHWNHWMRFSPDGNPSWGGL